MLVGTLGASLLREEEECTELVINGKELKKTLIPFHPLTNFEIIDYFKGVKGFNGGYPRNNLPNIKKEHT